MEQYNKTGQPVSELIENQIAKAKKNGRELSFDTAYEEVIADSMETMLTDGKVMRELASRDRTLFEKIKDFIADLAKKVKALYKGMLPNSNEGRIVAEMSGALDRVQAMFTDALADASGNYRDAKAKGPKNNAREGVRYSIRKDQNGDLYVDVDGKMVGDNDTPKQIAETLSSIVKNKFTEFVDANGQKIGINQRTAREWVGSRDASMLRRIDNQMFLDKANAFENADEILKATQNYIGEAIKHQRKDNFVEFARGVVSFKVDERGYDADVIVGTTKSGVAILYDLVNLQGKKIEPANQNAIQDRRHETPTTNEEPTQGMPQVQYERDINANSSNSSIPQPDDSVKRKFSDRDYSALESHFGTTRNYEVAGYLMTDGKMLDFSGRHWGDTSSDFRQVDHRDVYEVEAIESEFDNGREAMVAMIGDGNIRLNPESGGINLAVLPNAKQMTALRGYVNHFRGEVVVDVDEAGGNTLHSFEYKIKAW